MESSQIANESMFVRVRNALPAIVAALTAVFLLSGIPLYFHDGFFDINRAKVSLLIMAAPYMAIAMGLSLICMPRKSEVFAGFPWLMLLPFLLFVVSCIISCALRGFEEAVLTGNEGRYGGLYFILALATAFFTIALGRGSGIGPVICFVISSTAIAVLGCANALGVDPLKFYENMYENQLTMFMSTIGHFDFYGTFLLMPAAVAYGISVKGKHFLGRVIAFICAAAMTVGAYAARTDSVWICMGMLGFALFFFSGEDWRYMCRALFMIGIMTVLLPTSVYFLRTYTSHKLDFSGIYEAVTVQKGVETAVVFFIPAFICFMVNRHDIPAPGYKRLAMIGLIVFLVLAILLTCVVVYSTGTDSDTALFGLAPTFRINDRFGSRRGYIWIRAMRAFNASPVQTKIFGQGLELTKRATRPFIEKAEEEQLSGGTYNDTHCQPLQILLTCGILGTVAFLLHYLFVMLSLRRYAEEDPLLSGIAVAMFVYLGIMLINVTQPILLVAYFGLGAVAIARISRKRNGELSESLF
ncbi:MAG: O-antigen ligase family protein [Clostridia bacterium]|nr:O-antigen ligase family protein [Clostridia bacterium]